MKTRWNKEQGSVVVEATIVLPVFMLAIFCLLNFMNILMLHNRIQFAINASAHELASYSYAYTALKIEDAFNQIEADGKPYTSKIDDASSQAMDCLNKIQSLSDTKDIQGTAEAGKKTVESVRDLLSDPKGVLIGSGYIAADAAIYGTKNLVGQVSIKGLTKKYLSQGQNSADVYLKKYGVKEGYEGLSFQGTSMLNDSQHKLIDVVVEYDISLTGFDWIINNAKMHVVQRVSVPAWLDGDGNTPKKYNLKK